MKFERKTIITIVSSVAGVLLLAGIIGFATHARYEGRGFENKRGFSQGRENINREENIPKGNQAPMISGLDEIITTKDYTAFQTLFSGNRIVEQIDTPEKFATRVELQTTMKKVQALEAQLSSGGVHDFNPVIDNKQQGNIGGKKMIDRGNTRGGMMQRR